jgi:hypothetical protein
VGLSTAKAESNDVYACGDTSPKAGDDIYSGDEWLNTTYCLGYQPAATSAPLFLALRFKFFHENFLEDYRELVLGQSSFQTVLPVKCFVQFPFIWTYGICRGEDLAGCSCRRSIFIATVTVVMIMTVLAMIRRIYTNRLATSKL